MQKKKITEKIKYEKNHCHSKEKAQYAKDRLASNLLQPTTSTTIETCIRDQREIWVFK